MLCGHSDITAVVTFVTCTAGDMLRSVTYYVCGVSRVALTSIEMCVYWCSVK